MNDIFNYNSEQDLIIKNSVVLTEDEKRENNDKWIKTYFEEPNIEIEKEDNIYE